MAGFHAWLAQLQLDNLWQMLVTVASCVLCITFHETCHGLMAFALGDPTAKRAGRLTLNPMKHIDLFGLVMLAVAKFGWAKPVPVDMRRFRDPKAGMALTALAGPLGNLLLAFLAALLYSVCGLYYDRCGGQLWYYLLLFWLNTMVLSVGLAVFNLIPVPPLDGSKILGLVLKPSWYAWLMRYERYGMVALMILLLTGVLDGPLETAKGFVIDGLLRIGLWPYDVLTAIYF